MMQWLNEPAKWSVEGSTVSITTDAKTDFWRRTHYDFIRDNGHFYYQSIETDFTADVKITGEYRDLYDQAGIMLRLNEEHWIKCGIEYLHGVQQASVVATHQFSDWSIVALSQNPPALWLRVKRGGDGVEIFFSLDGSEYTMMRLAYFPTGAIQVGLMCASPQGDGFTTRFEDFRITA